ncbi:cell division initiation protein [Lachnospiraceae bacterium NE2001]|nr:cell division initiation protein [Lachnospiraceae bacterium NE2001]
MLTPLDVQQKKFKPGLGYDKKDVQAFFDEVSKSYGELYRSNAELKEKVITLTDTVQHYKSTENELNKKLLLTDKNIEESKTNAEKTAKAIENEAVSRGNEIIKEAKQEREKLENEILELTAKYAEYKANFNSLIRKLRRTLDDNDFDPNAANTVAQAGYKKEEEQEDRGFEFGGSSEKTREKSSSSGSGSSLSVGGGSKLSMANKNSNSSNVYGSTLGGDGIDPFADITFMDD